MIIFATWTKKELEAHIFNLIESIADSSSLNIDNIIKNKFTILYTEANNISTEEIQNPKKLISAFKSIVKENNLNGMALTTLDGIAYCDNGQIINISDRDYFKVSINGKRSISGIILSKLDGEKVNVFSIPVYINGNVEAVLWISVLTDKIYQELNLDNISKLGDIFILNSNGDIIASDKKMTVISNTYNLIDEINAKINNKNLEIIKKDSENLAKGYTRLKSKGKDDGSLYYINLNHEEWWLVVSINNFYSIITTIKIINVIIVLFISIVFSVIFTKEKKNYERLKNIAYIDFITGGVNDIYLKNNITKLIKKNNKFAFISLEIINIQNIITLLGIKTTERLLKEIYEYLCGIVIKDEIVVHSYLGEYKLLIKYTNTKEVIERLDSINFSKINENIKFKSGIYFVNDLETSYEDMYLKVSVAKKYLNDNINLKYMIYDELLHKKELERLRLEEDIKNGIKNKEFKAWFQPKFGEDGKSIVGAEALVRWYKYDSIISPHIFVPICEKNGLIKELDELVFEDVCKNIRVWIDNNKKVVPISVNLSRSYIDKFNFINNLEKYINKYKIPPELIQFEITESSLMGNEKFLKNVVSLLHEKKFKVLIDDFGVGYSSIKSISYVQFDILKIDKSFVDGIGEETVESIIKYTIKLAENVGMNIIAEGIEKEEQYKFLLKCKCKIFQGYYFSKPLTGIEFSKLI